MTRRAAEPALSSPVVGRWIIALVLSSAVVLWGVPKYRRPAFSAGWFERGAQTRRRRSQRRPTHGGVLLAVGLGAGGLLAGVTEPAGRAMVVVAVLTVASCFQAEAGRGAPWLVPAGRVAVALAVPIAGVGGELSGSTVVDTLLVALLVLAVSTGLRSIERSDGTVPLVAAIAVSPLLAVAVKVDDPVAPVAAALLGGALAVVAYSWPPAAVRIGRMGPTVLGAALAIVALELDPGVAAPRTPVVAILALATIGVAFLLPDLDLRLRRRGISCHIVVPIVAAPGALAAYRLADGSTELRVALLVGLIPVALLFLVGLFSPPIREADAPSHRLRNVAFVAVGVVVVAGVATLAAQSLWTARDDMQRGRDFATAGMDAARAGDLDEAQRLFATADAAFADATEMLDEPAVRVGAVVPGVAQNIDHARTLAEVGGDLSGTAVAVAERAGADDLQVVDGRFPVEAAREVSEELEPALLTLQRASERLATFDSGFLVDEVREGAAAVAERVDEATESIEVAAESTRLAPALLGGDGDRRWIVAVLAPSEERGAGGLAGDYAELRASDGDVELVKTLPAGDLNAATDRPAQLAALPDVYRDRYEGFRVDRFWQNLSATPDVPTFGQAIASAYPLLEDGGLVDGVIVIDPEGLAALLELTGPLRIRPWPVPLTSENIIRPLEWGHYEALPDELRDEFQGNVIEAVIDALTSGTLPPVAEMAGILGPEVAAGHLRLWSPEEDPQALFERIGADGRLGPHAPGTDFIQLVTQNAGENKIDWYMRRSLRYEATVDPGTGTLAATATVTITNYAPREGVSSYIIGEEGGPTAPGENELEMTLFSPHKPHGVTDAEGNVLPVSLSRERGLYAVTVFLEIPPGARSATVVVSYRGALEPTDGRYSLTMGRQPAPFADSLEAQVIGAAGWRLPGERSAELIADEDGDPGVLDVTFTPEMP